MRAFQLLPLSLSLCIWPFVASAEYGPKEQRALSAISPKFPNLDFIWVTAEGDLNSDGIPDLALVLTGNAKDDGPREERLVVLTGNSDGSYKLLSASGDFCHPGKFYNLDVGKSSVFVEAVEQADSASMSSYTLQFRYNAKLNDLEQIGGETHSQHYEEDYEDQTSSNYLTGKVIYSTRRGGKTKTSTERIARAPLQKLSGFSCGR